MKRRYCAFVVTALLLLMVPQHGIVAEGTSTLSGRVVDSEGQPVSGFGLTLEPVYVEPIPVEIIPAEHDQTGDDSEHQMNISDLESRTDEMGRFAIHNVPPKRFRLAPYTTPDRESVTGYEIVSMKIGAMTVHQHEPSPFGGIAFAIEPDAHIENVEIRVKPRQHIRGRILFADGTPLVSSRIVINVHSRSPDGTGSGSSSSSGKTDADGYFVFHADETAIYTVTVNHQGHSVTAKPFWLKEGDNKEDLLFTFDSAPISSDASDGEIEVSAEASTSSTPGDEAAWVVNPETGHAYKRIRCNSWDDANIQAVAEGAHLVTINDAAEQKWLSEIFGHHPYWIGLTDYAVEGEWVWENGEPVNFTNWAPHEPQDDDWGDEDFAIMDFSGEWADVGPNSVEWKMVRLAIIEKDGVTTPPGEK
ncbi:MAG: lectin-like protein [Candidatus Poribacteria bacterium]|nr:lectin-like protein [Candidatus Poribacteria bacterium]